MTELFPEESVAMLSPKLRWLDRHQLGLARLENGKYECALNEENFGRGETEDEACVDLCVKTQIRHWSQEV